MNQRFQPQGIRQVGGWNRPRSKGTSEAEQRPLRRVDPDRALSPAEWPKRGKLIQPTAIARRTIENAKNAS